MRQPLEDPERQAALIERHIAHGSDTSPRPIDWNAKLHTEALAKKAKNTPLDRAETISTLNQERTDYYSNKFQKSSKKDDLLAKDAGANWKEKQTESAEVEAQTHLS